MSGRVVEGWWLRKGDVVELIFRAYGAFSGVCGPGRRGKEGQDPGVL